MNAASLPAGTAQSVSPSVARLGPLFDVNAQCLSWLVNAAQHADEGSAGLPHQLGQQLARLSVDTQRNLAGLQFLLVDLHLAEPAWWEAAIRAPTRAQPHATWLTPLPRHSTVRLARSALVLTWHTARTDREAALLLLGLAPTVATALASVGLPEIDAIAEHQFRHLRPRWEDRPGIWQQLIDSAGQGNLQNTSNATLRCLQLVNCVPSNSRRAATESPR